MFVGHSNVFFFVVIIIPFMFALQDEANASYVLRSATVLVATALTQVSLFAPKMYAVYSKGHDDGSNTSGTAMSATGQLSLAATGTSSGVWNAR